MKSTRLNRALQQEVEVIIYKVIKDFYFREGGFTIKTVHEMICNKIKMVNEMKKLSIELACPSCRTVYRLVKKAEKNQIIKLNHG